MEIAMLTTIDNPYDPFDKYDEWYAFDTMSGYHCASFLARVAVVSDQLSTTQQIQAITDAIDEIIRENVSGMFVKVTRNLPDSEIEKS